MKIITRPKRETFHYQICHQCLILHHLVIDKTLESKVILVYEWIICFLLLSIGAFIVLNTNII